MAPSTIVTERRENDCSAINPSWIPSDAEWWRSVSTPSKSPASGRTLADFGDRFLRRVYTERERERYGSRISELAARFAAKEATSKALGTGIRGIRWREMEVHCEPAWKAGVDLARQRGGARRPAWASSPSTFHSPTHARMRWRLSSA